MTQHGYGRFARHAGSQAGTGGPSVPNFGFLLPHLSLLVAYGAAAESYVFSDPNTSLIKSRQFGEALAADLVRRARIRNAGTTQFERLKALDREGYLHGNVGAAFHEVRTLGNDANHSDHDNSDDAFRALQACFRLGVWYHRLLTGSREQIAFVPPDPDSTPAARNQRLREEVAQARKTLEEARLTYRGQASKAEAEQAARDAAERELAESRAEREELARAIAAEIGLTGWATGTELSGARTRTSLGPSAATLAKASTCAYALSVLGRGPNRSADPKGHSLDLGRRGFLQAPRRRGRPSEQRRGTGYRMRPPARGRIRVGAGRVPRRNCERRSAPTAAASPRRHPAAPPRLPRRPASATRPAAPCLPRAVPSPRLASPPPPCRCAVGRAA